MGNVVSCSKYISKQEEVLTEGALDFLMELHSRFNAKRLALLDDRRSFQEKLNSGYKLGFRKDTEDIRNGDWIIASLPEDLLDRRVEITGPVERKMIIHALNSGANIFMADFEDASSPTWENMIQGQRNLKDAIRREIDFVGENGRFYNLNENTAVLVVRPRGWHLEEMHLYLFGEPMSASLVDFGLYFYHNATQLIENGSGPYFYLPKLEHHTEARLWNDVFLFAQEWLGIPTGTIKATVLIETITAAFEMDEILFELKDHSSGLNCGRWDYIFSFIKKFQHRKDVILPNRSQVTMETPFMQAYSLLVIETCHKRNAPAIGGMAAHIPVKYNDEANREAFEKVRNDKVREVRCGHDGTWVAHPGMVSLVKKVFDDHMKTPNQMDKMLDIGITTKDLLVIPKGNITEEGLRVNVGVGIEYIAWWLAGKGAVPINNLMEDVATAEISRAQVWQWIKHPEGKLDNGTEITIQLVEQVIKDEVIRIAQQVEKGMLSLSQLETASDIFKELVFSDTFIDFLTIPAYQTLIGEGSR
ncbi:malate synthase A [Ornithinibacillus scapharcae]|uniref:malate synthase A n=1 Tax=Ornithinibacillus scapharcae TaxID=1147159 RepID=UPI000225BC24|nr:malate synthase A [Ornithinibacillus scapharcae]